MSLDALRGLALGATFDVLSVAITVTRPAPDNSPIVTTGIWLDSLEEDRPVGTDLTRREPRRVMAVQRTASLGSMPRTTIIVAPELEGGSSLSWRVEGYERSMEPDLMRVVLVRISD